MTIHIRPRLELQDPVVVVGRGEVVEAAERAMLPRQLLRGGRQDDRSERDDMEDVAASRFLDVSAACICWKIAQAAF